MKTIFMSEDTFHGVAHKYLQEYLDENLPTVQPAVLRERTFIPLVLYMSGAWADIELGTFYRHIPELSECPEPGERSIGAGEMCSSELPKRHN